MECLCACLLACWLVCFLCSGCCFFCSLWFGSSFSLWYALCVTKNDVYLLSRILRIREEEEMETTSCVVAYARLQNARKHTRTNGANILWIKFHLMCFLLSVFSLFYFIWIAIGLSNVNNPLMLTFFPFNGKLKRKIHYHRAKEEENSSSHPLSRICAKALSLKHNFLFDYCEK